MLRDTGIDDLPNEHDSLNIHDSANVCDSINVYMIKCTVPDLLGSENCTKM